MAPLRPPGRFSVEDPLIQQHFENILTGQYTPTLDNLTRTLNLHTGALYSDADVVSLLEQFKFHRAHNPTEPATSTYPARYSRRVSSSAAGQLPYCYSGRLRVLDMDVTQMRLFFLELRSAVTYLFEKGTTLLVKAVPEQGTLDFVLALTGVVAVTQKFVDELVRLERVEEKVGNLVDRWFAGGLTYLYQVGGSAKVRTKSPPELQPMHPVGLPLPEIRLTLLGLQNLCRIVCQIEADATDVLAKVQDALDEGILNCWNAEEVHTIICKLLRQIHEAARAALLSEQDAEAVLKAAFLSSKDFAKVASLC